jgi:phosphotransferase system IIB component
MKVDRTNLESHIEMNSINILNDHLNDFYKYCGEKYEYPASLAADYLSRRASLATATDFELFIMLDGFRQFLRGLYTLEYFFTDQEIDNYSHNKWKKKRKKSFPLKSKMIQVADDQWIGATTAKELMSLRNAQLISYNENIQRTLQRVVKGKKEVYIIKINRKAVNEIRSAMENDTFIPNTLTLNIPMNENSDFYYDTDTMTLTIRSADSLDIIDGYHRFVSITNAIDLNSKFDYPMELRITNYAEDKGQRFIYQEDQKTQMNKRDSNSFNVDDEAVKIARRLNEDPSCNFQGEINRNSGIINFAEMSACIKRLWFHNVNKKEARTINITQYKGIKECLNNLSEFSDSYLNKKYSYKTLVCAMIAIHYILENDIDRQTTGRIVDYIVKNSNRIDQRKMRPSKGVTESLIKDIEELAKEGVDQNDV